MRNLIKILLLMILWSPTYADYHYASHDGSNEYPYASWATAADVIYDAVVAADPGDTVFIAPGDWYESILMAIEDSNLAIIGSGIDSTYICADTLNILRAFDCANNTLLESMHLYGLQGTLVYSGGGNNFIIRDCLIDNRGAIAVSARDSAVVENCIFNNPRFSAIYVLGGGKMVIRNCLLNGARNAFFEQVADTTIIENNIAINIYNYGIWFPDGATNIESTLVRNNLFFNRTPMLGDCVGCENMINNTWDNIVRNSNNWGALTLYRHPEGENLRNNSISRMTSAFRLQNGLPWPWTVSASYFNLWDVDSLATSWVPYRIIWDTVGIQWADPMYIGDEDYHLQAYSPLIDAGDPDLLDIDGTRSDIGVYGGPYGESYTYLDLPPAVPDSLAGEIIGDTIFLDWRFNTEADFYGYNIHRDTVSGFTPSSFNLIAEPETSYYADTGFIPGTDYYYKISALDNQGNMSGYSDELAMLYTGIWTGWGVEPPGITVIESNYPNPFNSRTSIVYRVANLGPVPALINIDIYDIMGRKVRRLVDERREVGIHKIIWDGTDDSGEACPSGLYFARITQWGVSIGNKPKKLLLMK